VRAKVVKNKVAPPFRTAEFDIMFSGKHLGISREGDVLDLTVEAGIVRKQGAFFSYGDLKLGQGREQAKECLRGQPQLIAELESLVRQRAESHSPAAGIVAEEPPELE